MKKTFLLTGLIISLCLLMISGAYAQRLTGSLKGIVSDEEGTALPGVKVTVSSPALMGTQDFITTDTGAYRFPALPPGTYTVVFELAGFTTLNREGIIVSVGKTVTVNISLEPSRIEEEITVTAETPVVDVRSSTVAVTFTKDIVENMPSNRNLYNIIQTAPGAVADTWIGSASSVHGSVVTGNQYLLDGLNMTSPLTTTPQISVDLSQVEEMEMQVGAHPAEVSNVSGAYINVVTRSGGNAFHGEATAFYFNDSFVGTNLTEEQLDALGVAKPTQNKTERDFSVSLGGPIIKDNLWFFLSGRYYFTSSILQDFPADYDVTQWQGMGKLTLQVARNLKLMGYFNKRDTKAPNYLASASYLSSPETASDYWGYLNNVNAQANWILSPNAFVDIRGLWYEYYAGWELKPEATHQNTDLGTGQVTGSYRWDEYRIEGRFLTSASLTLFGDNILGGNHEFKFGVEYERTRNNLDCWHREPMQTFSLFGSPYVLGGIMGYFYALGYGPERADEGTFLSKAWSLNFYAQDSWTIQDRLTFNIGFRYDSSHGYLPAQVIEEVPMWTWLDPEWFGRRELDAIDDIVVFNNISPRLGVVYDIFGTGKTIAKASWSRYRDNLQLAMFYGANPNSYALRMYIWMDLNVNQQIDQNDFFINAYTTGREDKDPRNQVDQNAKSPYFDEFIVGIEHELLPDFRLGINYYNKRHKNIWEGIEGNMDANWARQFTVNDPGYDGQFGTGDDQQLTVFDRTAPGNQEPEFFTNPRDAWRKYHGVEFVFEKRMSKNWQFLGSVVFSKATGTIGMEYINSYSFAAAFDTPNWYINRAGRQDADRPIVVKLQGTYILPYGIILSGYFQHASGKPYQRILNIWAANSAGYVTVNAEEQGIRREPSRNYMSLRLEKTFGISDFGRLGLFVDVYNLFNSAYISTVSSLSVWTQGDFHGYIEADGSFRESPRWQKVNSVNQPRVLKLGVRFTF